MIGKRSLLLISTLLLTACGTQVGSAPSIRFIGVSAGNLQTTGEELDFRDRFETDESQLVGVVAFENIEEGATVQATWFSPDDRRMPLGRTDIQTASGAKVARFSFASNEPWAVAPYMLQIRAWNDDDQQQSASGSVRFYIGLTDDQIRQYLEAYREWEKRDNEKRTLREAEEAANAALTDSAKALMRSPVAVPALKRDLTGDGTEEQIFLDTRDQPEYMPSIDPSVLLSHPVKQMVVTDGSGALLLGVLLDGKQYQLSDGDGVITDIGTGKNDVVHVTLLPTSSLLLTWQVKERSCVMEVRYTDESWTATETACEES